MKKNKYNAKNLRKKRAVSQLPVIETFALQFTVWKGFFITKPSIVKRFLNDILEWLWSLESWAGFLPKPKVLKYLPDYFGLGSGDETYDLHLRMYLGHSRGSTSEALLMHSRHVLGGIPRGLYHSGVIPVGRRRVQAGKP